MGGYGYRVQDDQPAPVRGAAFRWFAVIVDIAGRLSNHHVLLSMQRGLALVLPLVMVGALALTIRDFPAAAVPRMLDSLFGDVWRSVCDAVIAGSFGIAALGVLCAYSAATTAIHNQRRADLAVSPAMTTVVVLSCFFVLAAPPGDVAWNALLSMNPGLPLAIIVAMTGSAAFLRLCRVRELQLPMGTVGSDPVVRDVLTLTPAAMLVILLFAAGRMLLAAAGVTDPGMSLGLLFVDAFRNAGDGIGYGLAYVGLSQALWLFGAHGPNMLPSLEAGVHIPAALANAQALAMGQEPVFIFTKSFFDAFTRMGGSGCTLCLIAAILLRGRNSGNARLCLFALLPALCNVNEPVLFGIPLVLNPVYAIPFVLTPLVQTLTAYWGTVLGLVPHTVPGGAWTTPVFFSGFMATGSWAGVGMQAVNLALGVLLYLPFVRFADVLCERQGRRVMHALAEAAESRIPGPNGYKCLDRPGDAGRVAKVLANDLGRALATNTQLFLEYQPQIDSNGNRVVGAEALLRWRHPVYGLIPPCITVALAEDTATIGRLGLFVLNEACAQRQAWQGRVPEGLVMSVNVSPSQLRDPEFARRVLTVLATHDLPAGLLELEITETSILAPGSGDMERLRLLRGQGVRVAIDDFGMGHTSLRYLQEFPVDTVKIDRSLTVSGPDGVSGHIVRSIVDLAGRLNIATVVEGVETPEQLERFGALGCRLFQGYLFSRPLSGEECLRFIRRQRTPRG